MVELVKMPQLDAYIFLSQFFWFLVVFIFLYFLSNTIYLSDLYELFWVRIALHIRKRSEESVLEKTRAENKGIKEELRLKGLNSLKIIYKLKK
jgi:hypothetical protein